MKIPQITRSIILTVALGIFLIAFFTFSIQKTENPAVPASEKKLPLLVRGSIPYWDQDAAVASFKENVSSFNQISLFWFFLDKDLSIKKYQYAKEDLSIIDFAHAHNVKVSVVLTNLPEEEETDWDSARVEEVLNSSEKRAKHIEEIAQKVHFLGVDGVTIDYEQVDQKEKDLFSLFIKELSVRLHQDSKFVGVALHPRTAKSNKEESIGFFQDWNALGKNADQLYIMAYGQHWDNGPAGPIASLPWVKRIVHNALESNLPKEKLFLGTGIYGYAWPKGNDDTATGLTFKEIEQILAIHNTAPHIDETSQSPHFNYIHHGQEYEVWFDNAQSVKEKVALAYVAGFAGASFWRLGGEDPQIWPALQTFK